MLPIELCDEIGMYIGIKLWSQRDKSKTYSMPGARDGEDGRDGSASDGASTAARTRLARNVVRSAWTISRASPER